MSDDIDTFYDALTEADEALARASKIVQNQPGVDVAEDSNLRRLRRIREDIGTVHDSVENYGFGYSDDEV